MSDSAVETVTVHLNTGITERKHANHRQDREAHKQIIMPLVEMILKHDGVDSCMITRYEIEVRYRPLVVTRDDVVDIIADTVDFAARQDRRDGYFPARGTKTPDIIDEESIQKSRKTGHLFRVTATFNTYIMLMGALIDVQTGKYDNDILLEESVDLIKELAMLDGIVGIDLQLDHVSITLDTRFTDHAVVMNHAHAVLDRFANRRENDYFPKMKGDTPIGDINFFPVID